MEIRSVAECLGPDPALGVDDGAPQTMEREVIDVLLPINHIAAPLFENRVVFVIVAPSEVAPRLYVIPGGPASASATAAARAPRRIGGSGPVEVVMIFFVRPRP